MIIILKLLVALAGLNFIITGIESYIRFYKFSDNVAKTILNLFSALCAILMFFLYFNIVLDEYEGSRNYIKVEKDSIKKDSVKIDSIQIDSIQIKKVLFQKIKATYYNPTSGQCDKTPLITGSGYKIDLKKLKNKEIKIVALSRDLLKVYPYGSTIYVHQPVHLRGTYKVEDTMNSRFRNRIDFLVYDKLNVDSVHISI